MRYIRSIILALVILLCCNCSDFLEEKTSKKLIVPTSLRDLQALLDNYNAVSLDPSEGEAAATDYYLTDSDWKALYEESDRRLYTWQSQYSTRYLSWYYAYRNVNYSNVILETIQSIPLNSQNRRDWQNVKGQAHFLRARALLSVANIWSPAYDENTAQDDLGIPIILTSDFNISSVRGSVEETYRQIIYDLETATHFLPDVALHVSRASKAAAYGLLARVYLFMRDYERCFRYADSCILLKSDLMDYSEIDSNSLHPFPEFNSEVIYDSRLAYSDLLYMSRAIVDEKLIESYEEGDLRRSLYFQDMGEGVGFRGSYTGSTSLFSGIALDEIFLMRAECAARLGNNQLAIADLNYLLETRIQTDAFEPITDMSTTRLLSDIIQERRKQLIFRGIRWPDIKRLNKEGGNIQLERSVEDVDYSLSPESPKFALPIPEEVIERAPGIIQNP